MLREQILATGLSIRSYFPNARFVSNHQPSDGYSAESEAVGKEGTAYIAGPGRIAVYVAQVRPRIAKLAMAVNAKVNQKADKEIVYIVDAEDAKEQCKEIGINTRGYVSHPGAK